MPSIRLATLQDIPALTGLLAHLFAQEAEFQPDTEAQQRGLQQIIEDPKTGEILVTEEKDRITGMVNLLYTISTALGAPVALLEDMVVDPASRNSGTGSALLQAAISHARQQGCQRITLLTDTDNLAARRFYGRHGFAASAMCPLRLSLQA